MSFDLFGDDDEDDSLFHPKSQKQKKEDHDEDDQKLPDLPFLNEKQEKDEILPNQNEKVEKIIENEQKEHTEKSRVEEIKQEPEIQQISKKVDSNLSSKTKRVGKKVHTKYDVENSLNQFKENLEGKFNELALQISSLKPERPRYKHASLSSNKIAEQVKSIVLDSAQKDREIEDLENKIHSFSSAFSELEERDKLRKQIQELSNELENQKMRETNNTNLSTYVQNLESQLKKIDVDHQKAEELEKSISKTKYEEEQKKINNEQQEMERKIKQYESDKNDLQAKLDEINKINEELQKQPIPDYDKELKQLKEKQKESLRNVIMMIAKGTADIIEKGVKQNRKYSNQICLKALQTALQQQADDILLSDDEYYSD